MNGEHSKREPPFSTHKLSMQVPKAGAGAKHGVSQRHRTGSPPMVVNNNRAQYPLAKANRVLKFAVAVTPPKSKLLPPLSPPLTLAASTAKALTRACPVSPPKPIHHPFTPSSVVKPSSQDQPTRVIRQTRASLLRSEAIRGRVDAASQRRLPQRPAPVFQSTRTPAPSASPGSESEPSLPTTPFVDQLLPYDLHLPRCTARKSMTPSEEDEMWEQLDKIIDGDDDVYRPSMMAKRHAFYFISPGPPPLPPPMPQFLIDAIAAADAASLNSAETPALSPSSSSWPSPATEESLLPLTQPDTDSDTSVSLYESSASDDEKLNDATSEFDSSSFSMSASLDSVLLETPATLIDEEQDVPSAHDTIVLEQDELVFDVPTEPGAAPLGTPASVNNEPLDVPIIQEDTINSESDPISITIESELELSETLTDEIDAQDVRTTRVSSMCSVDEYWSALTERGALRASGESERLERLAALVEGMTLSNPDVESGTTVYPDSQQVETEDIATSIFVETNALDDHPHTEHEPVLRRPRTLQVLVARRRQLIITSSRIIIPPHDGLKQLVKAKFPTQTPIGLPRTQISWPNRPANWKSPGQCRVRIPETIVEVPEPSEINWSEFDIVESAECFSWLKLPSFKNKRRNQSQPQPISNRKDGFWCHARRAVSKLFT